MSGNLCAFCALDEDGCLLDAPRTARWCIEYRSEDQASRERATQAVAGWFMEAKGEDAGALRWQLERLAEDLP